MQRDAVNVLCFYSTHLWNLNLGYVTLFLINTVKFSAAARSAWLKTKQKHVMALSNLTEGQIWKPLFRFLLWQSCVYFKRTPWKHFTGLDRSRVVNTQSCSNTWENVRKISTAAYSINRSGYSAWVAVYCNEKLRRRHLVRHVSCAEQKCQVDI